MFYSLLHKQMFLGGDCPYFLNVDWDQIYLI